MLARSVTAGEGQPVALHGNFTDPGTADTHTFFWHVVSSNGQVVADGTAQNFGFTPQDNGVYTVTFTVTDNDGGVGSDTATVTVLNEAPTAALSNGGAVGEGSAGTVSFSNPSDASPADAAAGFRYAYDFDNDGTF